MDYTIDDFYHDIYENSPEIFKTPNRLKSIVQVLENKGYFVKYSSPGYTSTRFENDRNKDGVVNGKLPSTARIIFSGPYKFGSAPKYWGFKKLDNGNPGLYVIPKNFNDSKNPSTELENWRKAYLDNLEKWAVSLPHNKE